MKHSQFATDKLSKHNELGGITALIIIPGDDLDEFVSDLDTGLSIKGGDNGGTDEIAGDDHLVGIAKDALELVLGVLLHLSADVLILASVLENDGEIDNGYISSGNTESHTSNFTVQLRNNLTNGLSSTSGSGDDVAHAGAAAAPVLLGGTVDGGLSGRGGVHRRHQAVLDTKALIENFADWGQAVSRAGGIGQNVHGGRIIGLVINTHDEHWGISRRSRDDDLLDSLGNPLVLRIFRGVLVALHVEGCLFDSSEDTSALKDDLNTLPLDLLRITLRVDLDVVAIDYKLVALVRDVVRQGAVDRVVLQHVHHVLRVHHRIIDRSDQFQVRAQDRAHSQAADTSEAIDTKNYHFLT